MTKARKKKTGGLKTLHWSIPAGGGAAVLFFAYWLFAPISTLRVAVPHPKFPIIRVAIVDTGANRYSFPLRVRWLDARGLKALRRDEIVARFLTFPSFGATMYRIREIRRKEPHHGRQEYSHM